MGVKEQSEGLERAIDHMCRKTRDLRRQLRKAVVDHVSDSFLETSVPLLVLIEAARNGRDKEVEEYALVFTEHANKLVEVSCPYADVKNEGSFTREISSSTNLSDKASPILLRYLIY